MTLPRPEGRLCDRYAKHHLLPFGERMPFQGVMPWLGKIDLGQAEWKPGALPAPMDALLDDGRVLRLGALICYESIFPSLASQAVRSGADVLVNITNDGWFGHTAGPVQHAEMARVPPARHDLLGPDYAFGAIQTRCRMPISMSQRFLRARNAVLR